MYVCMYRKILWRYVTLCNIVRSHRQDSWHLKCEPIYLHTFYWTAPRWLFKAETCGRDFEVNCMDVFMERVSVWRRCSCSVTGCLEISSSSSCALGCIYVSVTGVGMPLERSFTAPASSQHNVGTRDQDQGRPTLGRSLSNTEKFKKWVAGTVVGMMKSLLCCLEEFSCVLHTAEPSVCPGMTQQFTGSYVC